MTHALLHRPGSFRRPERLAHLVSARSSCRRHSGPRTTSVALEKEQVRVLAERLDAMLDLLTRRGTGACQVPDHRRPGRAR